jgi:hypothetical protein
LGIDTFLGGSILTVMFDEHFPAALPYMLDFGALVGFIQLILGFRYLTGYPTEVQFFYCLAFATMAVMTVLGSNLYIVFVKGKRMIGGFFAVVGTVPCTLATVSFVSAYLGGVSVSLPLLPLLPWQVIWGAFFAASGIIASAMVAVSVGRRKRSHGEGESGCSAQVSKRQSG